MITVKHKQYISSTNIDATLYVGGLALYDRVKKTLKHHVLLMRSLIF
jgi:hypothetical protein